MQAVAYCWEYNKEKAGVESDGQNDQGSPYKLWTAIHDCFYGRNGPRLIAGPEKVDE
jgi:hypothetical protein